MIEVPAKALHVTNLPQPFVAQAIDVIDLIESTVSNEHKFILVTINYLTKQVEAISHNSFTKKVVNDFFKNNIISKFQIPEMIITNNGANLNSDLMKENCIRFNINYCNSNVYRP